MWITRPQVDPVSAWNKEARYAALRCVQAAGRGSMTGAKTQLHLPMWEEVRTGQSVQPNEMTNEQTPFGLRLKGPAEVYEGAEVTQ